MTTQQLNVRAGLDLALILLMAVWLLDAGIPFARRTARDLKFRWKAYQHTRRQRADMRARHAHERATLAAARGRPAGRREAAR